MKKNKQKQKNQKANDFDRVWRVCEASGALNKLWDLQFLYEDYTNDNWDAGLENAEVNLLSAVDWILIQQQSIEPFVATGLALLLDCQPKEVEKIIKRWDKLQSFV